MFPAPAPTVDSRIGLILTILVLIVKFCPTEKGEKTCYVCFYKYTKRFKNLLEKIEKRQIPLELFYKENIIKIVGRIYKRTFDIVKNCRQNHGKSLALFDCSECLNALWNYFLSQVAPWTKNLKLSDMSYLNSFYYEVIEDIWELCEEICKKEIAPVWTSKV